MILLFKYLLYWFLDYVYVARKEVRVVFTFKKPSHFRTEGGKPILLIPGIYENWKFILPIASLLKKHGYDVHIVEGLGYNRGTVEAMANVVNDYIKDNALKNVTIVSHSKGGLVGKYALSTAGSHVINGLVALNAPFSGSRYAYLLPLRSLRIFIPNSALLAMLTSDTKSNARIVSIYGMFDPHIPGGSKLEGAKNVQLNTYGHFRIISDPVVLQAMISAVQSLSK
jgi:triacylglycerol lipase